jgi:beta-lactamase superfamily II metal-dependent hydrolase
MRNLFTLAVALLAAATWSQASQVRASKTLDIYVVDVEGGNATLFVAPSGDSVLIDAGNAGAAASRDADRIAAALKDAGISEIGALITTHWHGDHFGGMAELASRVPIHHFIDHGANTEPAQAADEFLQKTYPAIYAKSDRRIAKPGDRVPIAGIEWTIVTTGGGTIATPVARGRGVGQPNPYCKDFKPQAVNPVSGQPSGNTEDVQSVGSHIGFGRFRAVHLGDLTWNREFDLMCPTNRLGTIDLLIASRHGQPSASSEVLVHALRPRAIVINNGTRKGGQPAAMRILRSSPGLEDIWQLHFSLLSGRQFAAPERFIANDFDEQPVTLPDTPLVVPPGATGLPPPPAHNGKAFWIKVSAQPDGQFTVTNSRNGFSKTYK